mmetsp:Transcript_37536/g.27677  ORF Transcript_37536/g.27677 Transcript_37536/m.27677 type:complete len:82 (+) Transcript_37536:159-404(+)
MLDYFLDVGESGQTQVVLHKLSMGFDEHEVKFTGDRHSVDAFLQTGTNFLLSKINLFVKEAVLAEEWMNGPLIWSIPSSLL